MINPRLLSLIRKEFIQIGPAPRTLYITFAVPVVQIFLLGYTATTDVRNVPLAVFDQDRSPASRRLLAAYPAPDSRRPASPRRLPQPGRGGADRSVARHPAPGRSDQPPGRGFGCPLPR